MSRPSHLPSLISLTVFGVRIKNNVAHYSIFFHLLSLPTNSQTSSVCVLRLMRLFSLKGNINYSSLLSPYVLK